MDRQTFEKRRTLGYRDDPDLVTVPESVGFSRGRQLLLLLVVAIGSAVALAFTNGSSRGLLAVVTLGSLIALVWLPLYWFYQACREPTQKFAVEVLSEVLKEKMNKHKKSGH